VRPVSHAATTPPRARYHGRFEPQNTVDLDIRIDRTEASKRDLFCFEPKKLVALKLATSWCDKPPA
jgi:hypothetical protein